MLFQGSADLAFAKRVNREAYKAFMKSADVYLYREGLKDPLYGEATDKSFEQDSRPSYSVECYLAELPEWKAKLTKHGLDEERPLKAHFFADAFSERGVQPPSVGDHVVVEGERYKVMQTNPRDYFGNTQVAMTYSVDLQRVRPESSPVRPRSSSEDELYPKSQLIGDQQAERG